MCLSLLDGGQHLGTRLHTGLGADPLLDEGKYPLDDEPGKVPAFQDLGDRGIGSLLRERYKSALVEFDTDDIGLELLDCGPDILNALL